METGSLSLEPVDGWSMMMMASDDDESEEEVRSQGVDVATSDRVCWFRKKRYR